MGQQLSRERPLLAQHYKPPEPALKQPPGSSQDKPMATICITVPELKTITRALCSDWGPTLHAAARRLVPVVALAWALCSVAVERWQQLATWAQECRLRHSAPSMVVAQLAPAGPPALPPALPPARPPARPAANVPPSIRHLAAQGLSQRKIASTLGLTRYQVRKTLLATTS